MASIESFYPSGGVQTNTEGIALPAGNDYSGVLAEILRRRLLRPAWPPASTSLLGTSQRGNDAPRPISPPERPMKSELERAQERAAIIAARQSVEGPPLKYTYGTPSAPSHLEMDDLHMSPVQRQAFLPGASWAQPGGADTAADRYDMQRRAAMDEIKAERQMQEAQMQRDRDNYRYQLQMRAIYGGR